MLGCCFRRSRSPSRCFRRGRLLSRCFRGGKSLGCCLCGSKSPNCCFRKNKSLRSETHERPAGFWLAGRFACARKSGARKGVVGRAAGGAFAFVLGERVLLLAMNRARSAIGCHWLALAGIGWRLSWRVRIIVRFGRRWLWQVRIIASFCRLGTKRAIIRMVETSQRRCGAQNCKPSSKMSNSLTLGDGLRGSWACWPRIIVHSVQERTKRTIICMFSAL